MTDKPLFDNFDGRKMLALVGHWRPLADGKIPPPIANSLDFSCAPLCPNRCYFCNVRWTQPGDGNMTDETFAQVLEVYRRFGVKSSCVAGGGESLVHPSSGAYLQAIVDAGTGVGVITNGRVYRKMPRECRFVNVSINAATPEMYRAMCGVDKRFFGEVCEHIRQWVLDGQCVTYKVLITDVNKSPSLLAQSVEKAVELGCKSVLFRFAMLPWDKVGKQQEYAQLTELEADLFAADVEVLRRHYPHVNIQLPLERYDRCSRKYTPTRCTGGYVNFVTLWNGDCYICSDFRSNPAMRLCHISEIADVWGSDAHKQLVESVDPSRCPRCSFLMHNRICEEFVYHDASNQFFI